MKTLLIISFAFSAIVLLVAWRNYRRATRTDRKIDRKAKEAERREQDHIYEMKLRNIQLKKFRQYEIRTK